MQAPYSGPETTTSLNVLEELTSAGLPQPVMLLGGWAVYFTVRDRWLTTFGEEYFGSRDIDLGFHTPPDADSEELRAGNMPATLEALVNEHQFTRQGMYQLVRFHDWATHEALAPKRVRTMNHYEYYAIAVDLVASHTRGDLREIAGFQAFSEPLLDLAFADELQRRTIQIAGQDVHLPAPHLLIAMKLRSLPDRQKDDKSIKDLCDLYALTAASGVAPRTLRSRLHRTLDDAGERIQHAIDSPFLEVASHHLDQTPDIMQGAIGQLT
jgi:hypothetical protein